MLHTCTLYVYFQVYKSKIHLSHHERKVHSELFEAMQTCEYCHKNFKSKAYLRRHLSEVHPENTELIECENCTKRFKAMHHLKIHMRRVHPPDDKRVPCTICSKLFTCRLYMKRHCETQHLVTIGAQVCPLCTMPFQTKHKLNYHLEHAHYSEGKVQCADCGKYYEDDVKCNKHRMKSHNYKEPAVCPICNRQYKSREVLGAHLKIVHSPEHTCYVCGEYFDNEIQLYTHLQADHFGVVPKDVNVFCEALPLITQILGEGAGKKNKKRKYLFNRLGAGKGDKLMNGDEDNS